MTETTTVGGAGVKITVTADYEAAWKKTQILKKVPAAFMKQANDWAAQTVRYIKQSYKGGMVFARPPKELDARLGMRVTSMGDQAAAIVIGTGREIGREEVVYARIQEEGGWIVPKRARALAIPFPGVKGSTSMWRGQSFIVKTKDGNAIIATKTGKRGKIKPLFFLTKNVRLPARHWFSRPVAERMPVLDQMMSPEGVWARAASMAHTRTTEQGGE